ncbi:MULTISPECIES: hypothetical protein [Brevibacillus]|uniref:hypothetical protein n=2 Tax=Brevibacillus TaxID=55080 RepID=UPI0023808C7F|nr:MULTISPECIES: hypothetical protein [Brevibacillus]MDH6350758.1 hypothetical protein [Brevibacillus sp. 1238]MED2255342.1 hypothetical protein [Brevibacillus parabrevis]WDV94692.1 hypothetical protein PSE45_24115 [Brevibacillus parabrevis]
MLNKTARPSNQRVCFSLNGHERFLAAVLFCAGFIYLLLKREKIVNIIKSSVSGRKGAFMKRNFLVSIFLTLLLLTQLSGCSNEAASFQQTDSAVTEVGEALTFVFDSKEYDLPINQIQVLQDYLNEYTPEEQRIEIDRIVVKPLWSGTNGLFADVAYACGTKLCSHILVHLQGDNVKSLPLEPSSIFQQAILSPDEKYAAILLGRNEGNEVIRHHLSIIDLRKLELLPIHKAEEKLQPLLSPESFELPITDLAWVDGHTLEISVPMLTDFSYEAVAKWFKEDGPVTKLRFDIEN